MRAAADWRRHDRTRKIDRSVDVQQLAGSRFPPPDWPARERMLEKWRRWAMGNDPVKLETYRCMDRHENEGESIEDLARELGITPNALSLRISRLRKELIPKVRMMDREKPRMFILFLLWFAGAAIVVALLLLVFLRVRPTPLPVPLPAPRPTPSASAGPAPSTFDQALPPPSGNVPAPSPSPTGAGTEKPGGGPGGNGGK